MCKPMGKFAENLRQTCPYPPNSHDLYCSTKYMRQILIEKQNTYIASPWELHRQEVIVCEAMRVCFSFTLCHMYCVPALWVVQVSWICLDQLLD